MPKATVLSVDDDEGLQIVISHYLESEGYAILSARSGKQLVKVLEENTPNIILLDLVLPYTDGVSILAQLPGGGQILLIVASGKSYTTGKSL